MIWEGIPFWGSSAPCVALADPWVLLQEARARSLTAHGVTAGQILLMDLHAPVMVVACLRLPLSLTCATMGAARPHHPRPWVASPAFPLYLLATGWPQTPDGDVRQLNGLRGTAAGGLTKQEFRL